MGYLITKRYIREYLNTGKNLRQFLVFLTIVLFCAGPVQAVENSATYCMNAGVENDYDCAKVGTSDSNSQADISSRLSEIQRWLTDEEQVINGNSLIRPSDLNITDNKLQKRIEFNSQLLANELRQAQVLQEKGDNSQAFDQINSYLAGNPKDLNGWLLYGVALMDRNKLQAAEDIFKQLIQLYPDSPEPYNNLAAIYARRGNNNKAIEILLQGFNTHPSYAQLRFNLKTIYASLATQVYNRALDLDEKDILVTSNLVILDQVYVATPPQPFTSSPVLQPEGIVAVDQTIKDASEIQVDPESASPDATVSSSGLVPLDPATAKRMTNLIFRWADAWSGQDVNQYVSFYLDQYRTGNAVNHKQRVMWTPLSRQ